MLILDVNKVCKNFGYGSLFENVSFSLNEGECISIVGHNGCGKSTLLKMIYKLERIDSGSVSVKKDATVAYLLLFYHHFYLILQFYQSYFDCLGHLHQSLLELTKLAD